MPTANEAVTPPPPAPTAEIMSHTPDEAPPISGKVVTDREYFEALRRCDREFATERDRRYAEVNVEKEKALKIKETADLAALQLAREIQTYKDEKANELRSQIESERGNYVTKDNLSNYQKEVAALIKPLSEYIYAAGQGRTDNTSRSRLNAQWVAIFVVALIGLLGIIVPSITHW